MRIAVVCSDLGIRVPGEKGASLHLAAVTEALAAVGHEVLLVGVAGHRPPGFCPAVETLLLPHPGRTSGLRRELRKIIFTRRLVPAVVDRVQAFAPDVVYERLALFGTAGRALAHATGARHVVEVNALVAAEEARWRGLHLRRLAASREHAVLAGADLRLAVSREVAADVARFAPGPPVEVVPNGVDARLAHLPSRRGSRLWLGVPDERPVLCFVGALRPWHGVDMALRALSDVPGATLVVAGSGPVEAELRALACALGVGRRVEWLGRVDHGDVPRVLAAADVALAPYPALSGFGFSPLKLYEYLGAGVPVVASDVGQCREALGGGAYGRLVRPGDADALAGAVREVLADPAVAREAAARGRAYALTTCTWRQRALEITRHLERLGGRALAR